MSVSISQVIPSKRQLENLLRKSNNQIEQFDQKINQVVLRRVGSMPDIVCLTFRNKRTAA